MAGGPFSDSQVCRQPLQHEGPLDPVPQAFGLQRLNEDVLVAAGRAEHDPSAAGRERCQQPIDRCLILAEPPQGSHARLEAGRNPRDELVRAQAGRQPACGKCADGR